MSKGCLNIKDLGHSITFAYVDVSDYSFLAPKSAGILNKENVTDE